MAAGKTTAIGRIYAAAPERGAGVGRSEGFLAGVIAKRLKKSSLDKKVDAIDFADSFSPQLLERVSAAHESVSAHLM